jgi:hypothetical protein
MSISFQSTSTNNNNASNGKNAENSAYIQQQQQQQSTSAIPRQPQLANNVTIPPLLPNSALYQYNNDQMMHMHELYEEHHRLQAEATGRSTDV